MVSNSIQQRRGLGFDRIGGIVAIGAGIDLLHDQDQKIFGRTTGLVALQTAEPVIAGQEAGMVHDLLQQREPFIITGEEILDTFLEAAGAGAARTFRADNPTAQIVRFLSSQVRSKGGIGGIEEMMTFIEDIPLRQSHHRPRP